MLDAQSRVQFFIKFFGEETHAEQFLDGKLYMRKLKYFQNLESRHEGDGRPDANEGVVAWHQPDRVLLEIDIPGIGKIKLGPADLGGPVSISKYVYSEMHVFCMTALSITDPSKMTGDRIQIEAQLQNQINLDARCIDFGPYAVLIKPAPFIKLLRNALRNSGNWYRAERVQYYDEKSFHGEFTEQEVPFRKQSGFSYQKEYRVCMLRDESTDDAVTLEIGSIREFAVMMPSSEVNSRLVIRLDDRGNG